MARAITSPELTLLRSDGQWSELFLAFLVPNTVYTARLAALPSSNDQVYEITYNTGSGTLADVKAGMLLYVGTTAGAHDLGMCRIRVAPDVSKFYIGETSEIRWQATCYLTAVDDFDIHPRHIHVNEDGALLMDVNIPYTDQHSAFDPVPVLGPHAVVWLTGATVAVPWDASNSWVFDSTIAGYSWSAPGASATSGLTTATPTLTYNVAGIYRVLCTVTAANGKTATGARYVFVYDDDNPPATVFQLANCEGSIDSGGWMFDVSMQAEATLTEIREGTLAILFARDYYEGTEQSIGPIENRENIIVVGRVAGESIRWDPIAGQVHFTVYGPQYWMNKIKVSACQLEFSSGTPADWDEMKNLTVDRALWHLLHWRSTATMVMDFYPTENTLYDDKMATLANFLWAQLTEFAALRLMAHVSCDRYARLFAEIDPQMVPEADRDFPAVMTVTTDDWMDVSDIERVTVHETGQVNISTRFVNASGVSSTLYSLSPGHIPRKHGDWELNDGMLAASQAQSNQKAGLLLGWKNNEYPSIPLKLAANNRMIDICPAQYLAHTIASGDTPRGISFSGNIIPRRVAFRYNATDPSLTVDLSTEAETLEMVSCNGDIPGGGDVDLSVPPVPALPPLPDLPDIIPGTIPDGTVGGPKTVVIHDTVHGLLYATDFDTASPNWNFFNAGLTAQQKTGLNFFFRTPSGACYCGQSGTLKTGATPSLFLARASSLGGTWVTLYDVTNLQTSPGAAWGIHGIGYNPLASETVGVVMTTPAGGPYFYLGANLTFVQGALVVPGGYNFLLNVSYGLGKWLVSSYGYVRLITADGATMTIAPVSDGTLDPSHIRASTTGKTFHQRASGGIYLGEDNFTSFTEITDTNVGVGNDGPSPFIACDLTGTQLMTRYTTGARAKSSDGGTSWGLLTNLPLQTNYYFAYAGGGGSTSRWLAVGGTMIYYSSNFGTSWAARLGNLWSQIPTPNMDMVKVLEY